MSGGGSYSTGGGYRFTVSHGRMTALMRDGVLSFGDEGRVFARGEYDPKSGRVKAIASASARDWPWSRIEPLVKHIGDAMTALLTRQNPRRRRRAR